MLLSHCNGHILGLDRQAPHSGIQRHFVSSLNFSPCNSNLSLSLSHSPLSLPWKSRSHVFLCSPPPADIVFIFLALEMRAALPDV
jgi:hypothetical protein